MMTRIQRRRRRSHRQLLLALPLCLVVGIILADRTAHKASAAGNHDKVSAGMRKKPLPRTVAT
jgi:hypothetical protein